MSSSINLHTFFSHKQPRIDTPDVAKMNKVPSWSTHNGRIKGNNSFDNTATQDKMHISSIYPQMHINGQGDMFDVHNQSMLHSTGPSPYHAYGMCMYQVGAYPSLPGW